MRFVFSNFFYLHFFNLDKFSSWSLFLFLSFAICLSLSQTVDLFHNYTKKLINIYHNHKFSRKCFSDDLFSFSVVNNHCHIILLKINCQSKLVNYFSLLCFVEETVLLKQKSNKSNTRVCFVRYLDFKSHFCSQSTRT